MDLLAGEGVERPILSGPFAVGHADVATLVACGAADVGVAIEGVALAAGLGFVPLDEERFDLVVPADVADESAVARLLETLDDRHFRADAASLPGYDTEICGHVTILEAA
jgi:molybdate-binding protein